MDNQIKVLLLLPNLRVSNGVASYAMNYFRQLNYDTVHMDYAVYANLETPYVAEIEAAGGHVFILPPMKNLPAHCNACRELLRNGHYDIVHDNTLINSIPLMAEAKRQNVPVRILHSHNSKLGETVRKEIRNAFFLPFLRRQANVYAACSDLAAKAMFGKAEYTFIPNVIDGRRFCFSEEQRSLVRKKMSINEKIIIGSVGRVCIQKNPFFALEVIEKILKQNQSIEYWWVGSGPLDEEFRLRIEALGLDKYVKALGSREDVVDLYNAMDIFFLPSIFEGFGIVGVEAQAMGLPCVMSDAVPRETRYTDLVEYVSLEEPIEKWVKVISKQMERISDRQSYSKELGSSAFSSAHAGEKLEAYYKRLMETNNDS